MTADLRRPRQQPKRKAYLPDTHRTMPQSLDAEKGVICSCLLSPANVLPEVIEKGTVEQLYHPAHQLIGREMIALRGAGKPVDFISLTQALRDKGQLDKAGGAAAISELFTFVGTASNADYYIDVVREKFLLRELILKCTAFAGRAYEEQGDVKPLLDDAEAAFKEIGVMGPRTGLPDIEDAASLLSAPRDLPAELIEGVLHRGSKLVLGGGSKSFKTWSLLDLAISVATGEYWWDFATTQGRVLFLNFEIQRGFFSGRIEEICRAKGVRLAAGQLDVLNLRGFAADANTLLPQIGQKMAGVEYALIVLDPLYKLLGSRDENASRDMADLMNAIERLAVTTGAAVAFGSHFAKGNASGKESMDRISGSGVFARDPDSILTMTKHEEDDAFVVELTLRNHPPQEAFVVRRRHPLMERDGGLDPAKLKQVGGRKQEVSSDDVAGLLGSQSLTYTEWLASAEAELFISRDTFKRRLRELSKAGKVRKSSLDGRYSLALGAEGAVGGKTHLHPVPGVGCRTLIGSAPAPNRPIPAHGGAE